uniref:HMA domain-containing protein n=1 Tax=Oryza punctata TaxID=4537 RepID=A0A0E0JUB9_ORYPU
MASVVLKDLNKRLLGLSCSSAASTSIVLSGRAIDRHSPPHLRDPARNNNKKKAKKSKQQQLVSPASSSRFLLNSARMQPSADDNMELPPPFIAAAEASSSSSAAAAEENEIIAPEEKRESSSVQPQVVVLRVSLHCKGCAGKVKKHISRMDGVTSLDIDIATKKVTVVGDVTPLAVLSTVSKIKPAQFWPITSPPSSPMPPRASAAF